jgi:hypothetical protein
MIQATLSWHWPIDFRGKDSKNRLHPMDKGVCQVMAKVHMNLWVRSNKEKLKAYIYNIFASQGLPFGSPFSPTLADLEYILRIHALIFHWLRLPVHVSNQKTFYTEHMLSTKCKQRWHRNALIWQRFATSRFGSNKNIFPVCQSFETFTWLTISVSKLNLSQTSFSSLGAAIFNSPTYVWQNDSDWLAMTTI